LTGGQIAALTVVALGTLVGPLDSAVNIAFPAITAAFNVPMEAIQWVIISYVLTYGSLMLVFGKLGDLYGHRRIFLIGLAICTCAFLVCGMAPGYGWLIAARVFQGIGTALVIGCGPALATAYFPESMRIRVLGAYATAFGVGQALGPSLGGALVQAWGWEAVFWFRAPIAAGAFILLVAIPAAPRQEDGRSFDFAGAVLLTAAIATLMLTFNQLLRPSVPVAALALLAVASVATWAGFIRRERRVSEPIIRLSTFRDIEFSMINIASIVINFVGFTVVLLVPYYLARESGHSIAVGGLLLAFGAFGMVVGAPAGGWLTRWVPTRLLSLVAALCVAAGLWLIGQWPSAAGIGTMAAALLLQGFGMGLFQVTYLDRVTGTLARRDRGVAGSLTMLTRTIGVIFAATGLSLVAANMERDATVTGDPAPFLTAFQNTFEGVAVFLLIFLALTMLRPRLWFART
jgi:MFS family permease